MIARSWLVSVVVVSLFSASGCESFHFEKGWRVELTLLEAGLRVGESTRADVLTVLGEPNGRGRAFLSFDVTPKTVWSYYYEEATLEPFGDYPFSDVKDYRRMFLCVYFDGDVYDGYMWFSSLPR